MRSFEALESIREMGMNEREDAKAKAVSLLDRNSRQPGEEWEGSAYLGSDGAAVAWAVVFSCRSVLSEALFSVASGLAGVDAPFATALLASILVVSAGADAGARVCPVLAAFLLS